jgi:hypothetical protein
MAEPVSCPLVRQGCWVLGAALHSRARYQVELTSHHPFLKSDRALPIYPSPVLSYGITAGRGVSPTPGPSLVSAAGSIYTSHGMATACVVWTAPRAARRAALGHDPALAATSTSPSRCAAS